MSKVYLDEAAKKLGTSYEALRARVHRMMNKGKPQDLPKPLREEGGTGKWYWDRPAFNKWMKQREKLKQLQGK